MTIQSEVGTSGPSVTVTKPPNPLAALMRDLADRCQMSPHSDRRLDAQIWCALTGYEYVLFDGAGCVYRDKTGRRHAPDNDLPEFTSGIDTALRVVPRHHLWELKRGFECRAIVWMLECDYDDDGAPTGYSASLPALALCAAALRAHAELEDRK